MNILEAANSIIHGERNLAYGHPLDNHGCTALMWSSYLFRRFGLPINLSAEDVCWLNILQKVSREANAEGRDNMIDVAGYAGNVEMIQEERAKRSIKS